eukprot:g21499.t2
MDPVSFRPWIAFPLLVAACCCANAERQFQGLYTIVNVATERKLVADAQGFYTAAFDSIPKTQIWSITAGENATHTIQNAASGVRIYAQVGQERQRGFFVINSDTPVFRDQRWELQWQKAGGGYIIKNLKSQRAISDGPDGLMATVDLQPGSFWWIISQQRDEIGMELAKLEQSDDYQPGRAEEASKRFGIADGLELGITIGPASCEWADFARLNWDTFFSDATTLHRRSSLYLRASLVRKGMLAYFLAKKGVVDVMPKTLIADIEDQEDLDHLPRRVSKWMGKESTGDQLAKKSVESGLVLKASNANRGEHIYLVQSAAEGRQILLLSTLKDSKIRPEELWPQFTRHLSAALGAAEAGRAGWSPLPQCFELFGADFLLEEGQQPKAWLLEVNAGPDLAVFGHKRYAAKRLVRDVLETAVLPFLHLKEEPFLQSDRCFCQVAKGGFFSRELWSQASTTASPLCELKAFQRRLENAARLAKELHSNSKLPLRGPQGEVASRQLAFLAVIFILMVFRFFRGRGPDPDDFSYHIYKTEADGAPVEQVVRVQCPGVRHEDIEVKLIPNGCDVILHRRALPGLKEICWKHRFHFSLADGFFEFVEERMQLEHGFLILVLRAVNQDRTIRFAQHFQHFCMDAFDDEKLSFMARSCFKWHKPWIQGSTGTTLPWMQLRPASAKHQKVRTFCLWLAAAKAHRCHD